MPNTRWKMRIGRGPAITRQTRRWRSTTSDQRISGAPTFALPSISWARLKPRSTFKVRHFLFHFILKLDNSNYKIGMVETTTISNISQPTASSTIFSIKAKQDEDNSISVGIQFKNEESLLNEHKSHNKSHTHNAKKKKHWHHHKEEHGQGNINHYLPFQIGTFNLFLFSKKQETFHSRSINNWNERKYQIQIQIVLFRQV